MRLRASSRGRKTQTKEPKNQRNRVATAAPEFLFSRGESVWTSARVSDCRRRRVSLDAASRTETLPVPHPAAGTSTSYVKVARAYTSFPNIIIIIFRLP